MVALLGERHRYNARAYAAFEDHAQAWRPLLAARYGAARADEIVHDARRCLKAIIAAMPYIGGDENRLLRHLIGSSTSLALYEAMQARGFGPREVGQVVYEAVSERVRQLPSRPPPTEAELEEWRAEARRSREQRCTEDWVWDFVEGDGATFDYGYDFVQCPTQRLYQARGATAFLPYYCYLDFVTYRTAGRSFSRSMTLGEGHAKCDFRFRSGGVTVCGWPPPFHWACEDLQSSGG